MSSRETRGVPLLAALCLCLLATGAVGQVIPSSRCFTNGWRHAGYLGEIPAPAKIVNVRDYGALGNGVNNDAPAIMAAIGALAAQGGVVYFPAGTYAVPNDTVRLSSGVVLRGERSSNTEILATNLLTTQTAVISIAGSDPGTPWLDMQSGYDLHSWTVSLADVSSFTAGDWVETHQGTNAAWKMSAWGDMIGQILQVTNVTVTAAPAGTLTFDTPLRLQYQAGLPLNGTPINPQIRRFNRAIMNVGIENMRLGRKTAGVDSDMRDNVPSVSFKYAINCWVRGCEFTNVFGSAVSGNYSSNCEITGNYIHHANEFDGGGSGYGVVFQFRTGEFLVENNIFKRLRHSMLTQAGVNGNVFGYNYSEDMYDGISSRVMDMSCHGNYAYGNLFEGNCGVYINIDSSSGHGMNGPYNTFFRNRARATYTLFYPAGINLKDSLNCVDETAVGNETRSTRYGTGTGTFGWGNNINSTITPTGTDILPDYSYYLGTSVTNLPPKPDWWNIPGFLPVYGPTNSAPVPPVGTERDIPARVRFFGSAPKTYGPPSLFRQPTNAVADQGAGAAFSVGATGTPVAVYQWLHDGTPIQDATNSALTIPSVQPADTGKYAVVVSDSCGQMRSADATLTMIPAAVVNDPAHTPTSWLAAHGLATDTNAVNGSTSDTDHDGLTAWQEFVVGTDPTNAASVLMLVMPTTDGATDTVRWQSSGLAPGYNLFTSTNLAEPGGGWSVYSNNIAPTAPTNSLPIPNPGRPAFYKISVSY